MSIATVRRASWDDALLTLLTERPGIKGEELLAAIIDEANDAMARLRETGMLISVGEEE